MEAGATFNINVQELGENLTDGPFELWPVIKQRDEPGLAVINGRTVRKICPVISDGPPHLRLDFFHVRSEIQLIGDDRVVCLVSEQVPETRN